MNEDEIRIALRTMQKDPDFVTKSAYRVNTSLWPDHRISFVEIHIDYLKSHPAVDPRQYLSNLRLRTKR